MREALRLFEEAPRLFVQAGVLDRDRRLRGEIEHDAQLVFRDLRGRRCVGVEDAANYVARDERRHAVSAAGIGEWPVGIAGQSVGQLQVAMGDVLERRIRTVLARV